MKNERKYHQFQFIFFFQMKKSQQKIKQTCPRDPLDPNPPRKPPREAGAWSAMFLQKKIQFMFSCEFVQLTRME